MRQPLPRLDIKRWKSPFFPSVYFYDNLVHVPNTVAHMHETIEIGWALEMNCMLDCRDQRYELNQGDAAIIAPHELHRGIQVGSTPMRYAVLFIPPVLLDKLFTAKLLEPDSVVNLPPVQVIKAKHAQKIYRELTNTLHHVVSYNDQLLYLGSILSRLFNFRNTTMDARIRSSYHPAVMYLKSIIQNSFTDRINFIQLAREVKLHENYLISLFKSATGVPPHQFQIALKVELSRRLLEEDLSLSDVASAVGFADQSHLSRYFKRFYGVPPGTFRKSIVSI